MIHPLRNKSNLLQRLLTGLFLVVIICIAVAAGIYGFLLLLLLINNLSLPEFYRLFGLSRLEPGKIAGTILSMTIYIITVLIVTGLADPELFLFILPAGFIIFVVELFSNTKYPFQNLAITFLGIICITIPLSFFTAIAFIPFEDHKYHSSVVLGYFFILWFNDSGAYFCGKIFGKHKLFERISPNKTWEGSAGGFFSATGAAYLNSLLFPELKLPGWLTLAVIIVVTGTFGDLIKSMMKRSLHVKDSGTILPGHGGMLDRFDSLLGSAPFVFIYLEFLIHA